MAAQSKIARPLNIIAFIFSTFTYSKLRKLCAFIIASLIFGKIFKKMYRRKYDRVKYVNLKQIKNKKYDFIVVGAGTSGSCVAGLLARDGRKPNVLLIEAGDKDNYHPLSNEVIPVLTQSNQQTDKDWRYKTVPQKKGCDAMNDRKSAWPRGKIMGGCSILNYMVYVRGNAADYDEWANKHQCKGWDYKSLIPVFKSFEKCIFEFEHDSYKKHRGLNGLQKISRKNHQNKASEVFVDAATKCGYAYNDDYNGQSQDGVSYTQYNIDENGRRQTSFRSFVASLFDGDGCCAKNNLDILPNCQVTKVLSKKGDKNNKNKAFAVEINEKCQIEIVQNGEIIICGGAINSPQLLMLSGIGDVEQLNKHKISPIIANVPGVGQNLRDHITQAFRVVVPKDFGILDPNPTFSGLIGAFYQYLRNGKGPLTTSGLDAHIFTKSKVAKRDGLKSNDLQLVSCVIGENRNMEKAQENLQKFFNWNSAKSSYWNKRKNAKHDDNALGNSLMAATMLVRPKSVGTLKLASSNPYDHPLCDPNYLSNSDDLEAFVDGWSKLMDVFESDVCKKNGFEIVECEGFESREEWARGVVQESALTIYHPIGTCKMGNLAKDKTAVCSERLRVRGFDNLRVVDASIAPDLIAGNTQGMCYVIGVKGANMILEDWKK